MWNILIVYFLRWWRIGHKENILWHYIFGVYRIFPLVNYMNLFIGSGAISPISFIFSPCFYLFYKKWPYINASFYVRQNNSPPCRSGSYFTQLTRAHNLNTYKNILQDFVHKLWLFLCFQIFLLLPVWVGCWSWIYRPHWIYS